MRYILLFLFLFVSGVQAQTQELDTYSCPQIDLFKINLNEKNIMDAISKIKDCPSDDDLVKSKVVKDFNQYFGKDKQMSAYIKGYKLKGQKSLFYIARKMLGNIPPKGWSGAAKSCDTIICAFGKLLNSEKAAMQLFNFKEKSGYYLSLDQSINDGKANQIWSAQEIQELDAAADKLPKKLQKMKLDKIQRYADGLRRWFHSGNVAAYASPQTPLEGAPELTFYDSGAKGKPSGPNSYTSTSWPQEVLIHELCHHHDFKNYYTSGSLSSERRGSVFGKLSGWKEKTKKDGTSDWGHHDHSQFVSNYASSSPAEDYAESCMSYVLYPDKLQSKSPEKYNYMKKYLFNEEEFKQRPWSSKQRPRWDNLEDLLAKGNGCTEKISNCLKNILFEYGGFRVVGNSSESGNSTTTWYRGGKLKNLIGGDDCVKKSKNEFIEDYAKTLAQTDENFCENGGAGIVQKRRDDVCSSVIDEISKKLNKAKDMDIKSFVKICEDNRDYTKKCILDSVIKDLGFGDNEEAQKLVKKVMSKKIPDRMTSLGKSLNKIKSSKWLKACLKSVKDIDHTLMSSSNSREFKDSFTYYSSKDGYSSGFLGRFIYNDYKRKDTNMSCAEDMLLSLKADGIKTPESGSPVNLMQDQFKKELKTFETEVLLDVTDSIKKCLFIKKCKLKKVKALVQAWESKNPDMRSGMIDNEFIEELFEKIKPKF